MSIDRTIPVAWFATVWLVLGAVVAQDAPTPTPAGVVSAASPEAADAGRTILEAGGNAVDAAVAAAFALAVTEPAGSGIGGQAIALLQGPSKPAVVVNGTTLAPIATPRKVEADQLVGRRLSTVPSMVKVMHRLWKHHGSGAVTWEALLAPSIRIAEQGYAVGFFRHASLVRYANALRADATVAKMFLDRDGRVPPLGWRHRQPVLAKTLRRLAEAGAEDFYRGEIAAAIAEDMQAGGGWITAEDLAAFPEPTEVKPLLGTYRGYDVATLPPPAGGWVVLQTLKLLERVQPTTLHPGHPHRLYWIGSCMGAAHRRRALAPIRDLSDYGSAVDRELGAKRLRQIASKIPAPGSGETTHLSVVDGSGLAVALTLSINAYFGARVASPKLGFLYNNYMTEYECDNPAHPFAIGPRAMPYSSMAATILSKDGKPCLAVGSPGSRRIISAVVQVISRWVDAGQSISDAVAGPRLHTVEEGELLVEVAPTREELLVLELHGFAVSQPLSSLFREARNPYFGGVHAVALERDGWRGAADPRRDGVAKTANR